MKVMLDTNTCIAIIRRLQTSIAKRPEFTDGFEQRWKKKGRPLAHWT